MAGEDAGEVAGGGAGCVVRGEGRQAVGGAQGGDAGAGGVEGGGVAGAGGDALAVQPVRVGVGAVAGVEFVPGGEAAGAEEVVVAEDFADAEVGEDGGGDAAVQGFQGGGRADGHQEVGAVQDLAHVPVCEAAVGGQAAGEAGGQFLVREFLDVCGVFAGFAAQLDQHLAAGVAPGVRGGAAQEVRTVLAAVGYGGLGGEDDRAGAAVGGGCVRGAAQEGQGALDDAAAVRADAFVDRAETFRVVAGVGEDDVRAVPQQQAVGQLLVDDADIAGDDDGPPGRAAPGAGEPVQHRLDGAADAGEDDHVVPRGVLHQLQEVRAADLAQRLRTGADLVELADRGGGAAAEQISVQTNVRLNTVRCRSAPFPSGVRIREHRDTRRGSGTSGHDENARKAFRSAGQLCRNNGLTAGRGTANRPEELPG